jgi:PhnB protein
MQVTTTVTFNGQCEAAFKLYERVLGARLGPIFRYAGSPLADTVPPEWQDKIMHGSLTIGEHVVIGGDLAPDRYEAPRGFSLSISMKSAPETDVIFRELATEGRVLLPLAKTFWAERFGMVVDRFGIPWMINCEAADPSS